MIAGWKQWSEIKQFGTWTVISALTAVLGSLILGVFFTTLFYETTKQIPFVYQQDYHITLPLCRWLPDLSGCLPGAGLWTGLQIADLSQIVGKAGGMGSIPITVYLAALWLTIWLRRNDIYPGLMVGVTGVLATWLMARLLSVPLNLTTPAGIFGVAILALIPFSGILGGRQGKRKIAGGGSTGRIYFLSQDLKSTDQQLINELSPREREVLLLVAEGLSNREIALRLFISQATVKTHLIHMFTKLNVSNRTAAITKALSIGLLRQEEWVSQCPGTD